MKTNKNRTAEERYTISKRLMYLCLAGMAVIAGIIIYELVTGSSVSAPSCTTLCAFTCALSLNAVNMKKALSEMEDKK